MSSADVSDKIGVWCNWQHYRFWSCLSWFESGYPNKIRAAYSFRMSGPDCLSLFSCWYSFFRQPVFFAGRQTKISARQKCPEVKHRASAMLRNDYLRSRTNLFRLSSNLLRLIFNKHRVRERLHVSKPKKDGGRRIIITLPFYDRIVLRAIATCLPKKLNPPLQRLVI